MEDEGHFSLTLLFKWNPLTATTAYSSKGEASKVIRKWCQALKAKILKLNTKEN
jgi:hypothetical protein